MISRRVFFRFAGSASAASLGSIAQGAEASMCNPPSIANLPVRKAGPVEIAFKSPGPQPNGLQATKEGLWIIDQSVGSRAYLVDYIDGRVIRSFDTDSVRPSGITFDGEALWIGSTFSYENVRCSATTGAVIERRPTPGGIMYTRAGDAPQRRSPLAGGPLAQARAAAPEAGEAALLRFSSTTSRPGRSLRRFSWVMPIRSRTASRSGTAHCSTATMWAWCAG